jgi:hypothetical protein
MMGVDHNRDQEWVGSHCGAVPMQMRNPKSEQRFETVESA